MSKFPLSSFEEYIKPEDCSELKIKAYRMDGKGQNDGMSAKLGLGSIPLCDYWHIDQNGKNTLIEDTNLRKTINNTHPSLEEMKTIDDIKLHIKNLQDGEMTRLADQYINLEKIIEDIYRDISRCNYLKVYGSLMLISLLAQKFDNIKVKINTQSFNFLFVINDSEELRAIDHLESDIDNKIEGKIKGTLDGNQLFNCVKVVPEEKLEEELRSA